MVKVAVNTFIDKEDFDRLQKATESKKVSIYSFTRQAIIEKMEREGI